MTFPVFRRIANKVQAGSDAEQTNHFSLTKSRAVASQIPGEKLKAGPLILWTRNFSSKGVTKKQKESFLRNQSRVREICAGVQRIELTHVRLQLKGPVPRSSSWSRAD